MRRPSSSARPVTNATRPSRSTSAASSSRNAGGTWASAGRGAIGEIVPSMSQKSAAAAGAPAAAAHERVQRLLPADDRRPCFHLALPSRSPTAYPMRSAAKLVAGRRPRQVPRAVPIPRVREMSDLPDTTSPSLPGGKPRDMRADPYLKSMLLGLIEDSYLHTGTFTQFAAEVLQVIAYAVTVPVAFTEGFLKAYLSIDRVVEDDDGRIKIIPKAGATIEDMIRDVDEITAQVDPGAVFNPVVRAKLDAVHETSSKAMKWDLNTLSQMDDGQLMGVLREMQAESEAAPESRATSDDEATDYVRAKIATIRRNVRQFQTRHPSERRRRSPTAPVGRPLPAHRAPT